MLRAFGAAAVTFMMLMHCPGAATTGSSWRSPAVACSQAPTDSSLAPGPFGVVEVIRAAIAVKRYLGLRQNAAGR
jgi:hypothetical protein